MANLILTIIAALVSTFFWYKRKEKNTADPYKTVALVYMYWGAALMWLVDAIFEFAHDGSAIFAPEASENAAEALFNQQQFFFSSMNDLFLGFGVVVLGLIVWMGIVLVSDPKKLFRKNA